MKAAYYTLGCKVNQYDTQLMRESLEGAGYETVPFSEAADVYIVNTCTVTQVSDKKSRQMIGRAKRRNPNAVLVVCGCFSQVAPEEAAAQSGVDIVLGTANRKDVLRYIQLFQRTGKPLIETENTGTLEREEIRAFSERNRAVIKVEDGCENYCSYCLIPFARGRIRSKPQEIIRKEAENLAAAGFCEIVLTGIHLASYGKDFGQPCLERAIAAAATVPGVRRIRLGSLEPRVITPEFLRAVRPYSALCPHFHLSLQSGCDRTLRAMNRHYTAAEYRAATALLREAFPGCAITTDLIVGFPGETEEDFAASLAFAKEIGFSKIHIFPYSARKGTKAAAMPDQVSAAAKGERVKRAEAAELECRTAFWRSMAGKTCAVLPESKRGDLLHGFTENYCPIRWRGTFSALPVSVRVTAWDRDGLIGEETDEKRTEAQKAL